MLDLGGAEDRFGGGDAEGGAAVALADGGGFGGGFDFAGGEDGAVGEFEGDAEPYTGIGGHDQRVSFAVPEQECRHADQLGAFRGKALEIAGFGAVVIP